MKGVLLLSLIAVVYGQPSGIDYCITGDVWRAMSNGHGTVNRYTNNGKYEVVFADSQVILKPSNSADSFQGLYVRGAATFSTGSGYKFNNCGSVNQVTHNAPGTKSQVNIDYTNFNSGTMEVIIMENMHSMYRFLCYGDGFCEDCNAPNAKCDV